MKRCLCIFCVLMLPLFHMAAYFYDFESDGKYYNILSMKDQTLSLTSGETNYTGNLIIPEQVEFRGKTFTVTHIGSFSINAPLDTLSIPSTVVEIDDDAFTKNTGTSRFPYCDHIGYLHIADSEKHLKIGRANRMGMFEECAVDHLYAGRLLSYSYEPQLRNLLRKVTIGEKIVTLQNAVVPMLMESFVIPEQIKFIDDHAFSDCRKLTTIEGVERVEVLGRGAFLNCERLQNITLPQHLTKLGESLFSGCRSLKEIAIPAGVTELEDYVFMNCENLQRMVLPDKVERLPLRLFYGCSQLKEVVLPSNLQVIGFQAFCFCVALGHLEIPPTVKEMHGEAFASCHALETLVLPDSLNVVGGRLFVSCSGLKQCLIPNGVVGILDGAFTSCSSLTSITLPPSVSFIKGDAFTGCDQLKVIQVENPVPGALNARAFDRDCYLNSELRVPVGTKADYEAADNWMNFWNITEYAVSDALRLLVSCPAKGRVVVGNDTISNETYYKDFPEVTEVELKFLPDEGYEVKQVMVNDKDMTSHVEHNALTVRVDATMNVRVAFVHKTLVLDDARDTYHTLDVDRLEQVVYKRQFDDTAWQALYLPFALDYDDWCENFDIACIHDTHQYDDNHDGKVDRTAIEAFLLMEGTSTAANTPYLIRAKAPGAYALEKQNAAIAPAVASGFDCSSVTTNFIFKGTYEELSVYDMLGEGYYTLDAGVLVPVSTFTPITGFRWWMKAERRNAQQWVAPLRIEIDLVDKITGIADSEPDHVTGAGRAANVYNLQGKLVKRAAINLDGLEKGIYIFRGKKVMK